MITVCDFIGAIKLHRNHLRFLGDLDNLSTTMNFSGTRHAQLYKVLESYIFYKKNV
jgi:hypothetical protein